MKNSKTKAGTASVPMVQSTNIDYALHTLGWKAFQDLSVEIVREVFGREVEIYRPTKDGGRDAYIIGRPKSKLKTISTGNVTFQCKHTSVPNKGFSLADIKAEQKSITNLVQQGLANGYVVMTNADLAAEESAKTHTWLKSLGVQFPEVHGREWICTTIRNYSRLRALVPRVYGLGDLSWILDDRRIAQAQQVLNRLGDELKSYVPTDAHRRAVDALLTHRFVLLLGEPAAGKSTIAAILAATALDHNARDVVRVDGPQDIINHWNPNEKNRFFWVDDAFGSNQLNSSFIDAWNKILPSVQAALAAGNQFVLTSRDYIWSRAKNELRTASLPALETGKVVIDLGSISVVEREQILYNHLKYGDQDREWKARAREFLPEVAHHPRFLPETARRLGARAFTNGLDLTRDKLLNFVANPRPWLVDVIKQLPPSEQAAIALLFLYGGKAPSPIPKNAQSDIVEKHLGVARPEIVAALDHLRGSLVVFAGDGQGDWWHFKHPTIADAYSSMVAAKPELVEIYVSGAKLDAIFTEVIVGDVKMDGPNVRVPPQHDEVLSLRLGSATNDADSNRRLATFLLHRADDRFLRFFLSRFPDTALRRGRSLYWSSVAFDPIIQLQARINRLGLLPADVRTEAAKTVREAVIVYGDGAPLDSDELLGLLQPTELVKLGLEIRDRVLPDISEKVRDVAGNIGSDESPEDAFSDLRSYLDALENLYGGDTEALDLIQSARGDIESEISEINSSRPEYQVFETDIAAPPALSERSAGRSVFEDVHE